MPAAKGPDYINSSLHALRLYSVEELSSDPRNARLHNERNLDAIVFSLQRFGQQKPIVVLPDGTTVLAGNGTLKGARELGWELLAGVEFDSKDEAEQRGYGLADNRSAELAAWDYEELAEQLRSLGDTFELPSLGWLEHESGPLMDADWQPDEPGELPGSGPRMGRPINLTREQRGIFEQARQALIEKEGDITEGRAVELISAEFLSGA